MKLFRLQERRNAVREAMQPMPREKDTSEREEIELWQQRTHDRLRRLEASVDVLTRRNKDNG